MRPTAIIPLLFTLGALVLSLLCLFAGSKKSFLQNADLLTLNTSMLGELTLNTSVTGSSFLNNLTGEVQESFNDAISDVAETLNIHDFYSAHILDYCEGFYTPSGVSNKSVHPKKNVTQCSNRTSLFHFDPTAIIESELRPGIKLSDLKWPAAIQDGVKAVNIASKAMFVLYCIGIAATGIAFIAALVGVVTGGRGSALLNFILNLLAFIALGIASAIATAIIVKVVNAINKYGDKVGIAAYKGRTFFGMTWGATALMFLATIAWLLEFIRGRRQSRPAKTY